MPKKPACLRSPTTGQSLPTVHPTTTWFCSTRCKAKLRSKVLRGRQVNQLGWRRQRDINLKNLQRHLSCSPTAGRWCRSTPPSSTSPALIPPHRLQKSRRWGIERTSLSAVWCVTKSAPKMLRNLQARLIKCRLSILQMFPHCAAKRCRRQENLKELHSGRERFYTDTPPFPPGNQGKKFGRVNNFTLLNPFQPAVPACRAAQCSAR